MENKESSHKIKVYWDDSPENYSSELKNRVAAYFSTKYKVPKKHVNVIFRASTIDKNGNTIDISGAGVDNIMDINYQRELISKWLLINDKKVEMERLIKLDDQINGDVNFTNSELRHRRWSIEWLHINNFLCFGEDNNINFDRLGGLNLVNSEPPNQGGKTTFNIDAIKFLLFGKTTKTEKNEEIFNTFTDKNSLSVKGGITFGGKHIIIERNLTRKEKRDGGWSISNQVKFFEQMPDGSIEELNDESAVSTTKLITDAVGNEDDFDITTLSTANNLEDLIGMKPTMNGKLLNRFIGLEIIDEKLIACRKRYNDFSGKKLGNNFNIITLTDEIEELILKGEALTNLLDVHGETIEVAKKELVVLNTKKDDLLSDKIKIDESLMNVNTTKLEEEQNRIIEIGKQKKKSKEELTKTVNEIGSISFDEDKYDELTKSLSSKTRIVGDIDYEVDKLNKDIHNLENDEICGTCKRPLDDVDNGTKIKDIKVKIEKKGKDKEVLVEEIKNLTTEIASLDLVKTKVDEKDKLEVSIDKLDVELGGLRNELTEIKGKIKRYNDNKDAIDTNKDLDIKISQVKTKITIQETTKEETQTKINKINVELETGRIEVATKQSYIEKINKEAEVERIFKIYLELYGKKGIGKMVLKSILPIINTELIRLMDDVCDFTIELDINHKNDVEYVLVMDGVKKSLRSGSGLEKTIASLALRAVLGKMAYLPMPNFITFDEVLGKVAPINLIKLEAIFNKIKELYDKVFLITHNEIVKDWADNVLTVKKTNNVSELNIK